MSNCTVYIDESGDLGYQRGTRWFVLSAVIVDKSSESKIRARINQVKSKLNLKEIHFRKIKEFPKKATIVRELTKEDFTYINIIVDTNQLNLSTSSTSLIAYNFICRLLLERVSWFLRDTNRIGDIVLSARGTSKDGDLIQYIQNKLLPYSNNQIVAEVFEQVSAKPASSWDMLQLADVCATAMFLNYEINPSTDFCYPCFSRILKKHLYEHNGHIEGYGIKYFDTRMKPSIENLKKHWICSI